MRIDMEQSNRKARYSTHKFSQRLSQIASRVRQPKCKASSEPQTPTCKDRKASTKTPAPEPDTAALSQPHDSESHPRLQKIVEEPSYASELISHERRRHSKPSGDKKPNKTSGHESKARLSISEPRLKSGSLMIGESSSILDRVSSFRRPDSRAVPNIRGSRKAISQHTTDLASMTVTSPPIGNKQEPEEGDSKLGRTSFSRMEDDSPYLTLTPDFHLALNHRERSNAGRRSSDATLTGLLEKFDEIRAKCRDPQRPLPPTPRRTPPPENSTPEAPAQVEDLQHTAQDAPKDGCGSSVSRSRETSPTGLDRMGSSTASSHDINSTTDTADDLLESKTDRQMLFDSAAEDQFIFEEYGDRSPMPLPYKDRHKSVKPIDSQFTAPPTGAGYVVTPSYSNEEHEGPIHGTSEDPQLTCSTSIWRAGCSFLRRYKNNSEALGQCNDVPEEQKNQMISLIDRALWEANIEQVSAFYKNFTAANFTTERTIQISEGKISGLPRLLPIRGKSVSNYQLRGTTPI